MKLIFIYGLPGVGKLTVAKELTKLTGYRLFHVHLLADMLESVFEFDSNGFNELFHAIWPMVIRRAVEENVAGLITTFVFTRPLKAEMIHDVVDAIESDGGEVVFVELRCDRSELERRLVSPSRKRFRKLTSVPVLNQLLDRGDLAIPDLPGAALIVDNTALDPAQAALRIVESDSATS